MDRDAAEAFARTWVAHWNARDLEAILGHYSEDIVFHSPRIAQVMGGNSASVFGKAALRDYWARALKASPDLHFEYDAVFTGSDALTILYRNQRGNRVTETFIFSANGQVVRAIAAYAPA
ncbi:MAG: nuclear transport factor 2 family protein [Parvibaculum sp.]|nr:nuclear transport factor 2 family protein [Parvibaculum sp.]